MTDKNKTAASHAAQPVSALDFDAEKKSGNADAIITRYKYIDWPLLAGKENDNKSVVVAGYVNQTGIRLSNPKNMQTQFEYHTGATIVLTHPCKATWGDDVVDALPGEEVLFSCGQDYNTLYKQIQPLGGHDVMFWVAIRPAGVMPTEKGKNDMREFETLRGNSKERAPMKRAGKYLLAGPTATKALPVAPESATPAQRESAKQAVQSLES